MLLVLSTDLCAIGARYCSQRNGLMYCTLTLFLMDYFNAIRGRSMILISIILLNAKDDIGHEALIDCLQFRPRTAIESPCA